MGRGRKPVEMQKKHLTQAEKTDAVRIEETIIVGNEQLAVPPKWLINKMAKDEFKRIVAEFEKINIVGNLDLNNIAGYCYAYAMERKTTTQLKLVELVMTDLRRLC
ncbi:MAG: P27 family phage terminase small subunit [Clostridia bacterium]|nr:P27 family phage terminase small subunit [Clostridia bacterium]